MRAMKSAGLSRAAAGTSTMMRAPSTLFAMFAAPPRAPAALLMDCATSLLVPMIAAGVLSIRNAFPITLGANIGTTVTAMLAALVTGSWGLVIALVHLLFNLSATLCLYPIPAVRFFPVQCARTLARLTLKNRLYAVAYVGVTFILVPLAGMLIFKD